MGGGSDLDEAFPWLCDKANGGDLLILRARGGNDYDRWINKLCKLNSVATLVIPDRLAVLGPAVVDMIDHAEAIKASESQIQWSALVVRGTSNQEPN
jgi:cyanophycinase